MDEHQQRRSTGSTIKEGRREAEKAARELMRERAKLVGDLADAATNRTTATARIDDARQQGAALVREAEVRAAALLEQAQQRAQDLEAAYAEQYATATSAGWNPADLRLLGYDAPSARRARATTPRANAQTLPPAVVPHQATPQAEQDTALVEQSA